MSIMVLPNALAVVVHDDLDEMSAAVAQRIAEITAQAIAARGAFHIALSGGETPRLCYQKLRELAIDWKQVHIYFGDERCLPCSSVQRNDTMVRETLLDHVAIPPENVHVIPAELGAREAAAKYAKLLDRVGPLDLILLGMGDDGHTASLFPDNPAINSMALAVPVFDAPKPPTERVTLGIHTLNIARQKIFLVSGSGKRAALGQISSGKSLPAVHVNDAEWHLDQAALPAE